MIPARQPAEKPSAEKPAVSTSVTSLNWSGVALTNEVKKFSSASFTDIYSILTVPLVQRPFGLTGCDPNLTDVAFVGLDGYIANQAIQPGTTALEGGYYSQDDCYGDGTPNPAYWAEFGLFSNGYEDGFNWAFAVNPGDVMYVEVNDGLGGENPGYVFLEDLTTLTFSPYSVPGPGGPGFIGKSAEWIVSRSCSFDGAEYDCFPLPNLIAVFFDGGAAQTANGHVYYPGSTAASTAVITMRDDNDTQDIEIVKQGSAGYEGQHSLWFQTVGCAWSGGCVPGYEGGPASSIGATRAPGAVNKNGYPQGEKR
jgi:hypothetical protein